MSDEEAPVVKTHKDLDVWKKAIDLVKEVYEKVVGFPKHEQFGLVSQIRRAAISVPSNIAEGAARNSRKEFIQFLYIALGSMSELETQLIIAKELNYIDSSDLIDKLTQVRRMLLALIKSLKAKQT